MRILVMFDLPVVSAKDRRIANSFRRFLLNDGYHMLQYSVYVRICAGWEAVESHVKRLHRHIPLKGSVRVFKITERQFENMMILSGQKILEIDNNYEKNRVIIV